ncbi:hypothetical protein GW933_02135 [Candidatus Falkowbacteria bacterium]|uniref:Uncharacterized protein n=1 Tax=Candidatus Buchananbacteria bacterium CG10_big_fil_rev_8_21_14_0_10_33_19 TaxID=1974525 RepID=A0A2H0W3W5_9BACT|nr:hypothetical protein [Candidatus Falkowbacteria bacterium]PIS06046.1 MAG: hypothetical protein COT80_04755 [Candidatus Buchananbacteria bacterium CG10_big_fil_rev_8_21_14_0_10_33_19]
MLWIILRDFHASLADMKAAVELFKEVHSAESRGLGPAMIGGLVFETKGDIPSEDQLVLGIIPFS